MRTSPTAPSPPPFRSFQLPLKCALESFGKVQRCTKRWDCFAKQQPGRDRQKCLATWGPFLVHNCKCLQYFCTKKFIVQRSHPLRYSFLVLLVSYKNHLRISVSLFKSKGGTTRRDGQITGSIPSFPPTPQTTFDWSDGGLGEARGGDKSAETMQGVYKPKFHREVMHN